MLYIVFSLIQVKRIKYYITWTNLPFFSDFSKMYELYELTFWPRRFISKAPFSTKFFASAKISSTDLEYSFPLV